ncbi:hypothetical protein [Adhaeribacter radiodurans]|uniref:Uncharacterized protein n=1 Tax=Adhaeribacter radiodurans TaxID=2745197 RepID=A0A7L7L7J6_9BACT|nr:hypothetical protein [Adhaeribacter radiodurans]QMU28339.1 hypothetical protein HUW48_09975 [Adhaeribacter radiodurans]
MTKATILFKSPNVSVLRPPENKDGTFTINPAKLVIGKKSVLLEQDAAELLVNYLQVISAYFYSFQNSKNIIAGLFEQIGVILTEISLKPGHSVITNGQISLLIQQLGCLDEWRKQYPYTLK